MEKITALWQGAMYQDNLLQSYRNHHLTMQSILIAVGAGISVATLSFGITLKALFTYFILLVISVLGIYLLRKMRGLILARGEDVDYYHNQIITLENTLLQSDRVLTAFKVYQKFNREQTNIHDYFQTFQLNEKMLSALTEKGKGHTRRILDKNLFLGFYMVWACFHCVILANILSICLV